MKRLTLFESTIVGFLLGIVVATYLAFVMGTAGYMGNILSWLSLRPLLNVLIIPDTYFLIVSFIFFVVVYTIYGVAIITLAKRNLKSLWIIIPFMVVLIVLIFFEQKKAPARQPEVPTSNNTPIVRTVEKPLEQYFGMEGRGDLNGDEKEDVAFIISRKDDDRGTLYYLSAALKSEKGYTGTNLFFLGDKIEPQEISIASGLISITYIDPAVSPATTSLMLAQVTDGVLKKIEKPQE